jgi:uncharacterized protein (TIGR00304 family)
MTSLGKPISDLESLKPGAHLADNSLFSIGLLLVLAGIGLGLLAFVIALLRSTRGAGRTRGGGIVMIGPVPIIFGTDRESTRTLVLLAIVLMVVFFLLMFLPMLWR